MKIEHAEVFGFRASMRGLRNPKNSWDKSDTTYLTNKKWEFYYGEGLSVPESPDIGPNDLKLVCNLIKSGSEHRKFLRYIQIWMDITIPRYVWQELDTYKVATVRNSCSTMHKLGHSNLEYEDFEGSRIREDTLNFLNNLGKKYRQTKDYKLVREMKAQLPESFLQKATYLMNYETALTMFFQRKNHRLPEWNLVDPSSICSFIYSLPYMSDFIDVKEEN